ncbi:FkbM family methyltransferase [Variovorax sp. PCZ-1]|uniref:FkbM family methyltransferase n=1 Tax=Variovorax sp. PCZ-1 TaxID=2835533 RepID=UPI001BCC9189|nr:FkbM family methyltransferase [Variovorax sp. PCZ-1]MBS7806854.1 FkbM family methyltransferase [Variovorax sp. PCZ-1]
MMKYDSNSVAARSSAVELWGGRLRRLMQSSVEWPGLLLPLKLMVLGLGLGLLKWTALRRYSPEIVTKRGLRLAGAPLDSTLNAVVFYRGEFEPVLTQGLQHWIQAGDVCVDAGANVGYFTLLMAKQVGTQGKVIAIEAAPRNVLRIQRNLDVNAFHETHTQVVQVVHAACAEQSAPITFYINRHNDMHCRLQPPKRSELDFWLMGGSKAWRPVEVSGRTFKDILGDDAAQVSFIKLDIEGAEHHVVHDVLTHCTHPKLKVAMEVKAPFIRASLEGFEKMGFHLYDLRNNYQWLHSGTLHSLRPISFDQSYRSSFMLDVLVSRLALTSIAH